ncbi:hypothetical protein HG442_004400 [Candidatus Gracilibacteria bacterium]|nr:hypothetical protein [Candidatus Gracilibacteria bacterium]
MEKENLLDEERVETNLENNDIDETELDDIDLLQMEEEKPDYEAKYKELHAEHEKMRKAFVAQKKKAKSQTETDDDLDARLDARLAMREFYKDNPDAVDLKEKIEDYVNKGISREDALYLLSRDKAEAKKTAESRTAGRSRVNTGFKKLSADEYLKLSGKAQASYLEESEKEFGELVFAD